MCFFDIYAFALSAPISHEEEMEMNELQEQERKGFGSELRENNLTKIDSNYYNDNDSEEEEGYHSSKRGLGTNYYHNEEDDDDDDFEVNVDFDNEE